MDGTDDEMSAVALRKAIDDTASTLQAEGMLFNRVEPEEIRPGDFVVGHDCKLYAVDATSPAAPMSVTELHPTRGQRGGLGKTEVQCAFGVRRAN